MSIHNIFIFVKKSTLKNIIKECITEVLQEDSSTVYLSRQEYPDFLLKLFRDIVGKVPAKVRANVAERANLRGQDGEKFYIIDTSTGKLSHARAAWTDGAGVTNDTERALVRGVDVDLKDKIIVKDSLFMGKHYYDVYIHPTNVNPKALPGKTEGVSDIEEIVLHLTRSLKPAFRLKYFQKYYTNNKEEYAQAKQGLIQKGLMNAAGAITTSGRNYLEQKGWGAGFDVMRVRNAYLEKMGIDPYSFEYGKRIGIES